MRNKRLQTGRKTVNPRVSDLMSCLGRIRKARYLQGSAGEPSVLLQYKSSSVERPPAVPIAA